jgi:hypothetical protein
MKNVCLERNQAAKILVRPDAGLRWLLYSLQKNFLFAAMFAGHSGHAVQTLALSWIATVESRFRISFWTSPRVSVLSCTILRTYMPSERPVPHSRKRIKCLK